MFPDLEWKIIYVGSAESEEYDQVLDSVLVGPVPAGRHMFVFQVSSERTKYQKIVLCYLKSNMKVHEVFSKIKNYLHLLYGLKKFGDPCCGWLEL